MFSSNRPILTPYGQPMPWTMGSLPECAHHADYSSMSSSHDGSSVEPQEPRSILPQQPGSSCSDSWQYSSASSCLGRSSLESINDLAQVSRLAQPIARRWAGHLPATGPCASRDVGLLFCVCVSEARSQSSLKADPACCRNSYQ